MIGHLVAKGAAEEARVEDLQAKIDNLDYDAIQNRLLVVAGLYKNDPANLRKLLASENGPAKVRAALQGTGLYRHTGQIEAVIRGLQGEQDDLSITLKLFLPAFAHALSRVTGIAEVEETLANASIEVGYMDQRPKDMAGRASITTDGNGHPAIRIYLDRNLEPKQALLQALVEFKHELAHPFIDAVLKRDKIDETAVDAALLEKMVALVMARALDDLELPELVTLMEYISQQKKVVYVFVDDADTGRAYAGKARSIMRSTFDMHHIEFVAANAQVARALDGTGVITHALAAFTAVKPGQRMTRLEQKSLDDHGTRQARLVTTQEAFEANKLSEIVSVSGQPVLELFVPVSRNYLAQRIDEIFKARLIDLYIGRQA
jgi:hypothetical protein